MLGMSIGLGYISTVTLERYFLNLRHRLGALGSDHGNELVTFNNPNEFNKHLRTLRTYGLQQSLFFVH